jgi:phosphoglycerate dehydrogenase-like enzyme
MSEPFRVALSGDFRKGDGSPTYPDFDLTPLQSAPGVEVAFLESKNPLEAEQLEDFDALILLAHRFGAESVPRSGRLSVVARFGVGYDTVDVNACTAGDIALVITPDGVRRPVAVSIITLMLALTGRLIAKDKLTRLGAAGFASRSEHMGTGLVGRTLGSIGVGNIGAEMFRLARPFDMRFIAHDPFADAKAMADLGIELVSLDELFARSDVLAVNCLLTDGTRHLVNAARLGLMKPSAYFINTARGGIVDQQALTTALQNGGIAGAGLDVLEVEPPSPDDPLFHLGNVIVTPHALCWTDQCFAGNGRADINAVLDVQRGKAPIGVVNRDVLQRDSFRLKLERYRRDSDQSRLAVET